ncbi:glycosyltransferase family 2 protein [Lacimicrobium alkaliphilum]|uniref:Glycosyltransferase 2-like domain-containing protein n=1 Tax=Lacimicrobium alkaliphilum TaxID=1526571 RepID=A0ABQ1R3X5_9ALTE|nr:glycosyltransferase family 2 protein [Lacimicrobium alkaliphilum]GGD57398.1 hypothetical protein GCM10011357_11060 [Lacimicrobium alkaliphilum]
MKKYLVRSLKFTVGMLPPAVRQTLRQQPRLAAWYTKSLYSAGVLQYVPTQQQQHKSYKKNMAVQQQFIDELPDTSAGSLAVCIVVNAPDKNALRASINSVLAQSVAVSGILICCSRQSFGKVTRLVRQLDLHDYDVAFVHENEDIPQRFYDQPVFVCHSGEGLHKDCVRVLMQWPRSDKQLVYVDSDCFDKEGNRHTPQCYPDWNPDLQITTAYIRSGCLLADAKELKQIPHLCRPYALAQWLSARTLYGALREVQHIPLVLIHVPEKQEGMFQSLLPEFEACLAQHADYQIDAGAQSLNLMWRTPSEPKVSLVVPTYNGKALVQACVESILEKTRYRNFEILLVDNNSDEPASLAYFDQLAEHPQVRLLRYPYPFNYSAINNFAVAQADGEIIGLVNNDIEVIAPDWLGCMVGHVMRPDIGCVGAKLLYPDNRIQHAGVVMGYGGGAGHAHKYFPADFAGYLNRLVASHNFSAVTAACLLVTRADYLAVGGLDEENLVVAFNDVDFCLKVQEMGRRNLYCAEAVLYHHESISRGTEDTPEKQARFAAEVACLKQRWKHVIEQDKAYNPNLTLRFENFALTDWGALLKKKLHRIRNQHLD